MQSYSLGKRRKKRDGWLMIFTWLVLFVVVGLTGAWWWQNHKAAQDDLVTMADQNASSDGDNSQSIPLTDSNASSGADNGAQTAIPLDTAPAASANSSRAPAAAPTTEAPSTANTQADNTQPAVVSPSQAPVDTGANGQLPTSSAGVSQPAVDPNAVVMSFSADCWLEVTDAAGKKLFSGIQRSGGKLSLAGTAPYRLKIGAPAAVQIEYQGKPVDLSRYIRTNQVARLTLGAQ